MKKLTVGQNPWDKLSKEELLPILYKLYSATKQVKNHLDMFILVNRIEEIKEPGGSLAYCYSKVVQALEAANGRSAPPAKNGHNPTGPRKMNWKGSVFSVVANFAS